MQRSIQNAGDFINDALPPNPNDPLRSQWEAYMKTTPAIKNYMKLQKQKNQARRSFNPTPLEFLTPSK